MVSMERVEFCCARLVVLVYLLAVVGCFYATSWLLLGTAMEPDGAGWALALLYLCARIAGSALPMLSRQLPPLLAMLVVGLLLRGVGALDATTPLLGETFDWWSAKLRAGALAVIMLRAGLGIDLDKLRRLGLATARLAFLPCLCEALVILGLSGPLLGLPPEWSAEAHTVPRCPLHSTPDLLCILRVVTESWWMH